MKKLLVVFVLLLLAAAAWLAVRQLTPAKAADVSIRDVNPASVVVYTEAADLGTLYHQAKGTRAWKDLQNSSLLDEFLDDPMVGDVRTALEDASSKMDYPLDADNALKFVGREASLGFALGDGKGPMPWLCVTRIDVDGLAKDMLGGRVDWEDLRDELIERCRKADFEILGADHAGYRVLSARRGARLVYAVQMEDIVAVSSDPDLLRTCIDTRVAGGAGSLGRLPVFSKEMDALPAQATLRSWIHLAALDRDRDRLKSHLALLEEPPPPAVVDAILDGTRGAPALASAGIVPSGDLYAMTWQHSRPSREIFVDTAEAAVLDALPGDVLALVEAHDLGGLVDAWDASPQKRMLLGSEAWSTFRSDPAAALQEIAGAIPGAPLQAPDLPDLDPFTMSFGSHMVSEVARAVLAGDLGVAILDAESDPDMVGAVRLNTDGRLAELMLRGTFDADPPPGAVTQEHGARTIRGDSEVVFCQVGDLFLFATGPDPLRSAIDRVTGADDSKSARALVAEEAQSFRPGYRALVVADLEKAGPAIRREIEMSAQALPGLFGNLLDNLPCVACAAYSADDLSRFEVHWEVRFPEDFTGPIKDLYTTASSGTARSAALVPSDSFYYTVSPIDLGTYYRLIRDSVPPHSSEEIPKAIAKFEEEFAVKFEEEFLPAFGPEFALGLLFRAAAPPPPGAPPGAGPPPIPGMVLLVQVRDEATANRVLERALDMADEALLEDPSGVRLSRQEHRGAGFRKLLLPPREAAQLGDLSPSAGIFDGFLAITLRESVYRSLVDASAGEGSPINGSALWRRVADTGVRMDTGSLSIVDWDRAIDQLAQYADVLGQFVPTGVDADPPEYPENGDPDEWNRRMMKWQQDQQDQETRRAQGGQRVRTWLDNARLLEFIAADSKIDGNSANGRLVLEFKQ